MATSAGQTIRGDMRASNTGLYWAIGLAVVLAIAVAYAVTSNRALSPTEANAQSTSTMQGTTSTVPGTSTNSNAPITNPNTNTNMNTAPGVNNNVNPGTGTYNNGIDARGDSQMNPPAQPLYDERGNPINTPSNYPPPAVNDGGATGR